MSFPAGTVKGIPTVVKPPSPKPSHTFTGGQKRGK